VKVFQIVVYTVLGLTIVGAGVLIFLEWQLGWSCCPHWG
jgi:hypothetical protein